MVCTLTKQQAEKSQQLIIAFERARGELIAALTKIQNQWQGEIDAGSARWYKCEAGQAAQARQDILGTAIDQLHYCHTLLRPWLRVTDEAPHNGA